MPHKDIREILKDALFVEEKEIVNEIKEHSKVDDKIESGSKLFFAHQFAVQIIEQDLKLTRKENENLEQSTKVFWDFKH